MADQVPTDTASVEALRDEMVQPGTSVYRTLTALLRERDALKRKIERVQQFREVWSVGLGVTKGRALDAALSEEAP